MPDTAATAFSLIGMDLDVNTLFMVTMHVEIILGLLLFFAWAQNFSKRALAWWGSAHLMRAVSIMPTLPIVPSRSATASRIQAYRESIPLAVCGKTGAVVVT